MKQSTVRMKITVAEVRFARPRLIPKIEPPTARYKENRMAHRK
jgi:hypothetical protein